MEQDRTKTTGGDRDARRPRVRRADDGDVAELVRLRALLFETLGGDYFTAPDDGWRAVLATVLKERMTADSLRILVVDDGAGGLAACGIGSVEQRLPGPHLRNGRVGMVIGMVTDPAHRRRGHGRAIMEGLLSWFAEQDTARVDLFASADGEPLYRDLGFTGHPDPALYWRP